MPRAVFAVFGRVSLEMVPCALATTNLLDVGLSLGTVSRLGSGVAALRVEAMAVLAARGLRFRLDAHGGRSQGGVDSGGHGGGRWERKKDRRRLLLTKLPHRLLRERLDIHRGNKN